MRFCLVWMLVRLALFRGFLSIEALDDLVDQALAAGSDASESREGLCRGSGRVWDSTTF